MRGADIDPHQLSHPGLSSLNGLCKFQQIAKGLEALENRGAGQEAEGDQEVGRAAPEGEIKARGLVD